MGREVIVQNRPRNRGMNLPIELPAVTKKSIFSGKKKKKTKLFFSSLFLLEISCALFPYVELPVSSHFNWKPYINITAWILNQPSSLWLFPMGCVEAPNC